MLLRLVVGARPARTEKVCGDTGLRMIRCTFEILQDVTDGFDWFSFLLKLGGECTAWFSLVLLLRTSLRRVRGRAKWQDFGTLSTLPNGRCFFHLCLAPM